MAIFLMRRQHEGSNYIWLTAGISLLSASLVKIFDYLLHGRISKSESRQKDIRILEKHLDPILKSADELVAKLKWLAVKDFKELSSINQINENTVLSNTSVSSLIFLLSHFWSRIQTFREESVYSELGVDEKGKQLHAFVNTLESSQTRLLDRIWQRGIGEAFIKYDRNNLSTLTYYEFYERYREDENFRIWFQPILELLSKSNHVKYRQQIIVYGTILHALLDTLDKNHTVSKDRPSWANKLSKKSRRNLQYRVFSVYLSFVKKPEKYYAPK